MKNFLLMVCLTIPQANDILFEQSKLIYKQEQEIKKLERQRDYLLGYEIEKRKVGLNEKRQN